MPMTTLDAWEKYVMIVKGKYVRMYLHIYVHMYRCMYLCKAVIKMWVRAVLRLHTYVFTLINMSSCVYI